MSRARVKAESNDSYNVRNAETRAQLRRLLGEIERLVGEFYDLELPRDVSIDRAVNALDEAIYDAHEAIGETFDDATRAWVPDAEPCAQHVAGGAA